MQDISTALVKVIADKKCSSLLAFIEVQDGIHIQQSKSEENSCGRLRDSRDINSNGQAMGIHVHRDIDTGI